ncbi:MAG: M81 family metallopeptidase [Roseibium sp.]|uniref:M81 family metallopeptidase n=1 Tax=Roseibium sp. TaxID=1936156 RepID=UPI0026045509|nr:M81 family metallopeptidase [Roseibium sp.]MCV0425886.1 M81 family metallopeptidase [Roseibium sp.]
MRIGIAGFQHETNSFSPLKADLDAFVREKDWPGLSEGEDVILKTSGYNLPVTGALEKFLADGVTPVPLCWAFAVPSGPVTQEAYETIADKIVKGVAEAGNLDGLFLDLHGAMMSEGIWDGEGELLRRIRTVTGHDLPIAISLDLHANITQQMFDYADYIDVFRTYPHVDLAETGARTAGSLVDMVFEAKRPAKAFRKADFVVGLNAGSTDFEPAKTLYGEALTTVLSDEGVQGASLALGFHLSDNDTNQPSAMVYARTQEQADLHADFLVDQIHKSRKEFSINCQTAKHCIAAAKADVKWGRTPVVIADTQDNPGAGGTGDTTGLLRDLIGAKVESAVLGVIGCKQTVQQAMQIGVGRTGKIQIGGRRFVGDEPFAGNVEVLAVNDGCFTATGPMWGGARMDLGHMVLVKIEGVRVLISEKSVQTGDRSIFRHMGIMPEEEQIVCVKSSVHFRADFEPMAASIYCALAPGAAVADPVDVEYSSPTVPTGHPE